jgi:hypothetical protein
MDKATNEWMNAALGKPNKEEKMSRIKYLVIREENFVPVDALLKSGLLSYVHASENNKCVLVLGRWGTNKAALRKLLKK